MFYTFFSIKTAYEPCLTHIINQTIINLDLRIEYGVFEIIDYSFFTVEPIFLDFENLNILYLRAGDLSRLICPHSLNSNEIVAYIYKKKTFIGNVQ
jgi:hypothetical protein